MLKKLSKKAGARVVIHDPAKPPLPDEYGLDLRPNTATSMAIQKTQIKRLAQPYKSNCTKDWKSTGYEEIPNVLKYSEAVSVLNS